MASQQHLIDLIAAHRHSANHRAEIEASTDCGCFHCLQIFPSLEITAWSGWDAPTPGEPETENALTALCPRCGSESVIGDKSGFSIDAHFLNLMNEAWDRKTVIMKPRPKK